MSERDIFITIAADASGMHRALRNVTERLILHGVNYERLGDARRELGELASK